jgi:heme exporter protein A
MRLTATDLASERGERLVFEGINFTVGDGEVLAVVGPNGAGKSTLLRMIAGLLPMTAGTITIDPEPELSRGGLMHYLGHRDGLKQAMSVRENIAFWQKTFPDPGLSPLDALDRVRLGHLIDLPTSYLSAGQRRRVAIARLLAVRRPIWLLDEPTSALDAASEKDLGVIMTEHLAEGGTIIAATHLTLPVAQLRRLELGARP